ncbi:MAG TPA: PLD nuclease N-terminal domain-containing protein [Candidatus Limnocylindrales bacterium]|nr:PLD nuclease N-terminal domain-containing protein [Candidatus Limnocylindrales bacterium]
MPDDIARILPLLLPLIVLQLVLLGLALRDILRPERRVRGGDKRIWIAAIVLIQLIGPLVYFIFGRDDS